MRALTVLRLMGSVCVCVCVCVYSQYSDLWVLCVCGCIRALTVLRLIGCVCECVCAGMCVRALTVL